MIDCRSHDPFKSRESGVGASWRKVRYFEALGALSTLLFVCTAAAQGAPTVPAQATPVAKETLENIPEPRDANADLDREIQALQAHPGGLTAAQAAARALAVSYDVTSNQQKELAADSEIVAARVRFAPRLTLGASYTRLSPIEAPVLGMLVVAPTAAPNQVNPTPTIARPLSFPVYLNQTVLRASLVVPLSDYFIRFPQLLDSAKSGKDSAHYNLMAQRARTVVETKIAYYSWAGAVLQHVAARQAHQRGMNHLENTKRVLAAGLATNADFRAVEAEVAQAELLETRASNLVAITAEQVRVQLHLPPETDLEIGEQIITTPTLPQVPRMEQAWLEAQQSRPELLALSQTEHQIRRQADATLSAELPRVDAIGELLTANPNSRYQPPVDEFKTTWAIGIQATWTVNDWPSNAAAKKGLEAQAAAVAGQREALKQALRMDIMSAARGVEQASTTIATAQRGVNSAETAYRVRKDQYLAGRATNVELTDAETELTRARIEYIDALVDARIAAVRLEYALGRSTTQ